MPHAPVTCPSCGPVRRPSADLDVLEFHDFQAIVKVQCPGCGVMLVRTISLESLLTLTAAARGRRRPEPVRHPEDPDPARPPLTADDVLDGMLLLRRADWLELLTAAA